MLSMSFKNTDAHDPPVHEGCDKRVAAGAKEFYSQCAPYSMQSRRYPIVRLVESVMDEPWRAYVLNLPDRFPGKRICKDWVPSKLARTMSLKRVEDLIIVTVSIVDKCRPYNFERKCADARDLCSEKTKASALFDEFSATLSTIREIAFSCKMKKSAKTAIGKLNARRKRPFCAFCSEPTELVSTLAKLASAKAKGDLSEFSPDERLSFSSKYCLNHKPKLLDNTWNPAYKQARRSRDAYISLVRQIECHTANVPDFSFPESEGIGSRLLWFLARYQNLYLDDETQIRKIARTLTDFRIRGRKENIIFMLLGGMTQSEVARKLGISRQAVCKVANSEAFDKVAQLFKPTLSTNPIAVLDLRRANVYSVSASASTCGH